MGRKKINLIGRKFGMLTVVKLDEYITKEKGESHWICRCDCGEYIVKRGSKLTSGNCAYHCGCSHRLSKDYSGQRFGMLEVVERVLQNNKGEGSYFICKCDCGEYITVKGKYLSQGDVKSCGNHHKEFMSHIRKTNEYEFTKEYVKGKSSNSEDYFYVDIDDFGKIKNYCWFKLNNGYMASHINDKIVYMHRLIMDFPEEKDIDHINKKRDDGITNELDNRKSNLRICEHCENTRNRTKQKNNKSGFKGVSYNDERKKWVAQISKDMVHMNLGYYKKIEDAVNVRHKAELELFGDFACLD